MEQECVVRLTRTRAERIAQGLELQARYLEESAGAGQPLVAKLARMNRDLAAMVRAAEPLPEQPALLDMGTGDVTELPPPTAFDKGERKPPPAGRFAICRWEGCGKPMTQTQADVSYGRWGEELCQDHDEKKALLQRLEERAAG